MDMVNNIQTAILVGGRGTRLQSLTDNIPKPMLPIQGKPFLEILLQLLKNKGLSRFLLLSGYLHNTISDYFGDGSKFGLEIQYSVESKPLGTGGALKNAENLLDSEFLLLNGDTFSDVNYENFIKFSKEQNTLCTMICYNGPKFDDIAYNLVLGGNHLINRYSKTSPSDEFNAVDAGMYFMKKEILDVIKNNATLEDEVFPLLISKKQLSGFTTSTRFYDIGTLKRMNIFDKMFGSKKAYNQSS